MGLYAVTTVDVQHLLNLGLSAEQVAHRMGRSVDAVHQMLSTSSQDADRVAA